MPIRIPNDLPAASVLERENIFIMKEGRAAHQDIRPLRIAILNLMPKKIETETQLLRLLGNSPLQVDIDLMQVSGHQSRNTAPEHLLHFYHTFPQLEGDRFDGLIVTGAPVEQLPFQEVDYWEELAHILDWSKTHVYCTLHICWGAQAGLWRHYGIQKQPLGEKLFGVFRHRTLQPNHPLTRGFDEVFLAPHSRHTTVELAEVARCPCLEILADSPQAGLYIAARRDGRQVFVTGHSEYDRDTLHQEYRRDVEKGLAISLPEGYYPGDDPAQTPSFLWRGHANLFYVNWLNHVYQNTPYDLALLQGF
ncbi:MAG: homoserine O-succinyltransferase [Angelakisella sp.]|nr:homoserine O-succinyltransferase [Angelakisella sp.]